MLKFGRLLLLFLVLLLPNAVFSQGIAGDSLAVTGYDDIEKGSFTSANVKYFCSHYDEVTRDVLHKFCGYLGTATIIKGMEFANITQGDIWTENPSTKTIDLYCNGSSGWGSPMCNFCQFTILNNITPSGDIDTVIIRISVQGFIQDITVLIFPIPKINISFKPAILAPGDTADVIIKRERLDGTLVDLLPSQEFRVGILDGCQYGRLRAFDDQDEIYKEGSFLWCAVQPVKFIADSGSSGNVLIDAGVFGIQFNRSQKKKIPIKSVKKILSKLSALKRDCSDGQMDAPYTAESTLLIEDPCGNYPKFEQSNYTVGFKPKFNQNGVKLKDIRDGSITVYDACELSPDSKMSGGSMPLEYSCFESDDSYTPSWDLQPLTEKDLTDNQEYVHFQLVIPGTTQPADIIINVVTGICTTKIYQNNPAAVLMTNDEIGYAKIPPNNKRMARQAEADFLGHYNYPTTVNTFFLYDAILQHEIEHMNNFLGVFEKYKADIIEDIADYRMLCKTYSDNIQEQTVTAKKMVCSRIRSHFNDAITDYHSKFPTIEMNPVKGLKIENDIQHSDSYTNIVRSALSKLRSMYSEVLGRK
jgi:hypothetical protein